MRFSAAVEVTGLDSIADPAGQTIERALPLLGHYGIGHVRVGKLIRFEIEAPDEQDARRRAEDLCERLLANPVIEQTRLVLSPAPPA
ncbi:MAG: phosphoribosylformylglycinamidine synthase subunit PurS [Acidimicrobiales bacterium]